MDNLFEFYIENEKMHCKDAKGEPAVKEQEFHDYNEFVYFIGGSSFFISKDVQRELTPGSIVVIPKEKYHQFCVKNPETYTRCILAFRETDELKSLSDGVMDGVKVIPEPDRNTVTVFEDIAEIMKSRLSDSDKELFLYSSLVRLMAYFKLNPSMEMISGENLSDVVSRALSIIDERYAENISVKLIAECLYVSPSTLSHKFRKELNISVYRYITKKRLSAAHMLIQRGESMVTSALKSGFTDYSCFFRLYKKYYCD